MSIPKLSDIKNWSPEVEKQITPVWKAEERFKLDAKKAKKIYSIDTPPPYINSPIHMGHAVTYAFMDMTARYRRMKGFDVLFPLGLDRNGLPIEMAAEKKYNISAFKMTRDEFLAACEKLLAETSAESIDSFAKLGISFTSYKEGEEIGSVYNTDSPEYRSVTQATFIDLYKKGLIYENTRINNWDPKLRTTVADAEIEYKDIDSTFNHVKWKVKGSDEEIIIATTRPELICTVGAVIYNPEDKRYQHLKGKRAISPIFGKEVQIMPHPFAKIDKGSGLVMMCAGGDLTDIQFFREMKLKPQIAVTQEGKMNELAGEFAGLKVREAREKTIEKLKSLSLLQKQEQIKHNTPVSERSGAEIEFIEMPEFYLKQLEFKEEVRKTANKINFYPKESKKILDSWIDSVAIDWPISRRRFYATPVPLWNEQEDKLGSELIAIPKPGPYYQPWKQEVPKDAEIYNKYTGEKLGIAKDSKFKDVKWTGETRVLDTWFDSSISELVMLKYKKDDKFFKKAYPANLRPQGKEIVRTWLYYTILRGYLETKEPCFTDTWIHQHILDAQGRKMSKSLGNGIDPQEIIRDFGAEAMRFWSAIEGDLSKQDLLCSKDKIKAELKTMNKLLNVAKFVMQFEKPNKKPKLVEIDELFISYIEDMIKQADKQYEIYDFHGPALKARAFLWDAYASHYIEIVKNRAYNQENKFSKEQSDSAKYTLYYLLENLLTILYPIIPQITSVISTDLGIDLHVAEFPKGKEAKEKDLKLIEKIAQFNSNVWKAKREKNISLKESISGIEVPKELKAFEQDLKACHNLI
ncbi:MAG TPA: valine--tRNA ligase [Candidatus Nanoarchaeia archaeon]|nr:valine--tRNA ligase [Candidatus Nanoarchaeia archaeon]